MSKRKQLSKKTRFDVFKRDLFTCQYCGSTPPKVILHVDHIVPVAKGGTNSEENLITSCDGCNLGKGATPLDVVPEGLADRAARIAESEAQIKAYQEVLQERRIRIEDDAWFVADLFIDAFRDDGIRSDWLQSIKKFIELIGLGECYEAMKIAIANKNHSKNKCFLYFCGVCWRKVKEGK